MDPATPAPSEPAPGGRQAKPAPGGRNALRTSTTLAMVICGALVAVPYLVPGLERFRLLTPLPEGEGLMLASPPAEQAKVGEADVEALSPEQGAKLALPEKVEIPPEAEQVVGPQEQRDKPPVSIDDPSGKALDAFFHALRALEERKDKALLRISVWGDSNVAGDLVTAALRRKLQDRYGDGGHGFVLLGNPTPYYFHNDVWRQASNAWAISRIPGPLAADGLYGYGGVSFRAKGPAAFARIGTAQKGSYGRAVSRLVVDYLAHPDGQKIEIHADGELEQVVDTKADEPQARFATLEVPDGPHKFEVRASGADVRVFGVSLEREGPAVVVDALGVTSAKIRYLSRIESSHWVQQLQTRKPALAVFNFGVNEAREGEKQFGVEEYERTMKEVLIGVREALPDSSCLLVSPNDIAWKTPAGDRISHGFVPKLAAAQRKVAAEVGCAFWNMYEAMGGSGSMGRWVEKRLAKPDMLHPTSAGAHLLGNWLYLALLEAYDEFRAREAKGAEHAQLGP